MPRDASASTVAEPSLAPEEKLVKELFGEVKTPACFMDHREGDQYLEALEHDAAQSLKLLDNRHVQAVSYHFGLGGYEARSLADTARIMGIDSSVVKRLVDDSIARLRRLSERHSLAKYAA